MADVDDILKRLEAVEKQGGQFARAITDLREALTITAETQRRLDDMRRRRPPQPPEGA